MNRWPLRVAYANATLAALFGAAAGGTGARACRPPAPSRRPRRADRGPRSSCRSCGPEPPPDRLEVEGDGDRRASRPGSQELRRVGDGLDRPPPGRGGAGRRRRSCSGAVYDDGRSVEVDQQLTVVPGSGARLELPLAGVAVGAFLAVAARGRLAPPRTPREGLVAFTGRAVPAVPRRRPRLRVVPGRRRGGGRRRGRRSAVRDRAAAARRPSGAASGSCATSRRTRTPTTSRATAGSRSSTASRSRSTPPPRPSTRTTRSRTAPRSSSARSCCARSTRPGHRPEHTCLAVVDRSRADEPWLVLTGDSLFVGDAARPDLAVDAKEGAEGLFHSLRRLLELAGRRRGLPRPRRRLALRQGDELEGVVDDRLRAALQRRAADRGRVGLRRRVGSASTRRSRRT